MPCTYAMHPHQIRYQVENGPNVLAPNFTQYTTVCKGQRVNLIQAAYGFSPFTYIWKVGGKVVSTARNYEFIMPQSISIQANIKDSNGCSSTVNFSMHHNQRCACDVNCQCQKVVIPQGVAKRVTVKNGATYTLPGFIEFICVDTQSGSYFNRANLRQLRAFLLTLTGSTCNDSALKISFRYTGLTTNCIEISILNSKYLYSSIRIDETDYNFDLSKCDKGCAEFPPQLPDVGHRSI